MTAALQEIVNAYLQGGVERGDWRALDALATRVLGKAKETVQVVDDPLAFDMLSGQQLAAPEAGGARRASAPGRGHRHRFATLADTTRPAGASAGGAPSVRCCERSRRQYWTTTRASPR